MSLARAAPMRLLQSAAAALLVAVAMAATPESMAKPAIGEIALTALPKEGRDTFKLIEQGGPFPYPKDGVTFGNREGVLAKKSRGYYREYTVKTPGANNRGARRIVCGGNRERTPTHAATECYYSDNHYASFSRIKP
jgi:ribonuclease T1